ncbi:hypothetical protein CROQUDRAFT_37469 [Cronartium quercuum f. sp. fusiforme G11]|uniref:mRNA guanylyltransferase n=1 Tax=Cronartium quercuum f. sp. fusiforme G11 TaxID=708437 RepID=A0A9P6NS30_9BASI|nr:hypothetical protein CROQUDRAFT_37469 [Cronartium quercuum f. sp. fusiforme G11]
MVFSPSVTSSHLPGQRVTCPETIRQLKTHRARLCNIHSAKRFIGSQPVTLNKATLKLIQREEYWVCEKSDGMRVMVMIVDAEQFSQQVYMFNRKDELYRLQGIRFPHYNDASHLLEDTMIDGEFVVSSNASTGREFYTLLAFDCLVLANANLMKMSFDKRYQMLKDRVIMPLQSFLSKQPTLRDSMPFEVCLKGMAPAHTADKVLLEQIPKLTHPNDGLIFTRVKSDYQVGATPSILKWKPTSGISIDFRLKLEFPSQKGFPGNTENSLKPTLKLMMNCGKTEEVFDTIKISDVEWEELKNEGGQLDNRIVEVVWNSSERTWRILRFRNDKKNGNYHAVVREILTSIQDGVEVSSVRSINFRT